MVVHVNKHFTLRDDDDDDDDDGDDAYDDDGDDDDDHDDDDDDHSDWKKKLDCTCSVWISKLNCKFLFL